MLLKKWREPMKRLNDFLRAESGAVTVDFVMLTAAILAMVFVALSPGMLNISGHMIDGANDIGDGVDNAILENTGAGAGN